MQESQLVGSVFLINKFNSITMRYTITKSFMSKFQYTMFRHSSLHHQCTFPVNLFILVQVSFASCQSAKYRARVERLEGRTVVRGSSRELEDSDIQ